MHISFTAVGNLKKTRHLNYVLGPQVKSLFNLLDALKISQKSRCGHVLFQSAGGEHFAN